MATITSQMRQREFVQNVPVNMPKRLYQKLSGDDHGKAQSYKTIYFCPVCRRAWQPVLNKTEYFRPWIKGDENKICDECKH